MTGSTPSLEPLRDLGIASSPSLGHRKKSFRESDCRLGTAYDCPVQVSPNGHHQAVFPSPLFLGHKTWSLIARISGVVCHSPAPLPTTTNKHHLRMQSKSFFVLVVALRENFTFIVFSTMLLIQNSSVRLCHGVTRPRRGYRRTGHC